MKTPTAPTCIITTPEAPLAALKDRILAGLISRDTEGLHPLVQNACESARVVDLGETDEKYLRQCLVALLRFKHLIRKDALLYSRVRTLQTLLADKVRLAALGTISYADWEKQIDPAPWQTPLIFSEAITFQMTSGCSNFCRRCNEWALPKTRSHFSFNAVTLFIQKLLDHGNRDAALYGGSDPLDWCDSGQDITHVLRRFYPPGAFSLLTKIPKRKGALAIALIKAGIPMSVSLTDRNRERIKKLEQQMGHSFTKQHATSDLLIPAGLDEDFSTVKPSITDSYGTEISPDGVFAVIPAFTSGLHPFGHKKVRITAEMPFIPVKKLGRPALLVDYFKPLEVFTSNGRTILPNLLDVQVENILLDNGLDELTPPGMRSVKEYFDIFSDKARLQRKKMTRSVVRRLNQKYQGNAESQTLSPESRQQLKNDILTHAEFTKKQVVADAMICAVSFFLSAIRFYLLSRPQKVAIIRHLTLTEFQDATFKSDTLSVPISHRLAKDPSDPWRLFRDHTLNLIHGGDSAPVDKFIRENPARYHGGKDRFVTKK